eukprot:gene28010-33823_t
MMKTAVIALMAAAVAAETTKPREYFEEKFYEHMTQFKLQFKDGAEFLKRLGVFAENLIQIEAHNANPNNTYQLGTNQFTHLTFDEFIDAVNIGGTRPPNLRRNPGGPLHTAPVDVSSLPASVDWTTQGAVTPVKDQGQCGSCWSFSTTGAMEGAYFLKFGTLPSFSEQQLVSCDTGGADAGCNGGWMDDAFTFAKKNGGLTSETQYPYTSGTSGQSGTCKTGFTNVANSAPTGYVDVTPGNVNALMSAVAQQPVSIAIQANQIAFQSYKSGVLTGKCGQNLDHGVLAVGYGTLNG